MMFENYVSGLVKSYLEDLEDKEELNEIFEGIFETEYKNLLQKSGINKKKEEELDDTLAIYDNNLERFTTEIDELDYTSNEVGLANGLELSTLDKINTAQTVEEKTVVVKEILKVAFDMCYDDIDWMKDSIEKAQNN